MPYLRTIHQGSSIGTTHIQLPIRFWLSPIILLLELIYKTFACRSSAGSERLAQEWKHLVFFLSLSDLLLNCGVKLGIKLNVWVYD